jgi:hypothetical protein
MADTLFGGTKSGTPIETRGGTSQLADFWKTMMDQNQVNDFFGRLTSEAMMNQFGFDPSSLGLEDAMTRALADPRDATAGLFSAMQPFEAQETDRQISGLRGAFGTMGGRFSKNLLSAEGQARGELAGQFGRNREQALLGAQTTQNNALATILQAASQGRQQAFNETMMPWQMMQSFFQPGAPIHTGGILPGILQLAGTWAMMKGMGGRPAVPGQLPSG